MTVGELIDELRKWPLSAPVHIDVSNDDGVDTTRQLPTDPGPDFDPDAEPVVEEMKSAFGEIIESLGGWEGDRVVRGVDGVRWQSGFKAVAIDAQSFKDSEQDEANWIDQPDDTEPLA